MLDIYNYPGIIISRLYPWGVKVTLDELKNDKDIVVEVSGIKVIYDSMLEANVNGITIDYSNRWFNREFSIRGESFSC